MSLSFNQNPRFVIATVGEIMCRLAPVNGRIHTATTFQMWHGGGEYNVARGMRAVFGETATHVTALPKNPVGMRVENFMREAGVDVSNIIWREFDGLGRECRVGLNFTEEGFGLLPPLGVSDRGHSAASQMTPEEVNWEALFSNGGVGILHSGGIFAALSDGTSRTVIKAMEEARKHGTITSYDLNFRPSLYKKRGGSQEAIRVNREIVQNVDIVVGNEEDFKVGLGIDIPGLDKNCSKCDPSNFMRMIESALKLFPNLKVIATSLREVVDSSFHNWGGIMWMDGEFYLAEPFQRMPVRDRIGGGDSFASGLAWGLWTKRPGNEVIKIAQAHGALAAATPGDTSMATKEEVLDLAGGGSARIKR